MKIIDAEHRDADEEAEDVRDREDRVAEQPHRDDRLGGAQLDEHEQRRRAATPATSRPMPSVGAPAVVRAGPGGVEQERADTGRRSGRRRGSRSCGRGVRAACLSATEVMTRATRPIGTLMKKIHCQPGPSAKKPPSTGPSTRGRAEDGAEVALVAAALARRDDVADHRERQRHQAAAAEALDGAEGDQLLDVLARSRRAASRRGR